MTEKYARWVPNEAAEPQFGGEGVTRRVLAYTDSLMCVDNTFEKGAVGSLHSHPHTQITYVAEGVFSFTIDGETRTVRNAFFNVREVGVREIFRRIVTQNVRGILRFKKIFSGSVRTVHAVKRDPEMRHDPGKVRSCAQNGIIAKIANFFAFHFFVSFLLFFFKKPFPNGSFRVHIKLAFPFRIPDFSDFSRVTFPFFSKEKKKKPKKNKKTISGACGKPRNEVK